MLGNPPLVCSGAILEGQRFSVLARNRRRRSASDCPAEPCASESLFVAGREGREELIHAIRVEVGKDRGRSVAPVCRRRRLMLGFPRVSVATVSDAVAGLVHTVRTVPDTVASSMSMPVRRRVRARRSLSGRRPSDMGATKSDVIPVAELDRASWPFAFRRDIRVRFGSFLHFDPAFLLSV
jgi:hypothetical protein